jgi:hypothetical protein
MSDQELEDFRIAVQKFDKAHNTPAKAREVLRQQGLLTAKGQLRAPYRQLLTSSKKK